MNTGIHLDQVISSTEDGEGPNDTITVTRPALREIVEEVVAKEAGRIRQEIREFEERLSSIEENFDVRGKRLDAHGRGIRCNRERLEDLEISVNTLIEASARSGDLGRSFSDLVQIIPETKNEARAVKVLYHMLDQGKKRMTRHEVCQFLRDREMGEPLPRQRGCEVIQVIERANDEGKIHFPLRVRKGSGKAIDGSRCNNMLLVERGQV